MKSIFSSYLLPITVWCFILLAGSLHADDKLTHPWLVYTPADKDKILKLLTHGGTGSWQPGPDQVVAKGSPPPPKAASITEQEALKLWNEAYGRFLAPTYSAEFERAPAFLHLSILTWLNPAGKLGDGKAYMDIIKDSITALHVPTQIKQAGYPAVGEGNEFVGAGDDKKIAWGRLIDESAISLYFYAIAYDMLASSDVQQGGLASTDLDTLYQKLADGIFHFMVEDVRQYDKNPWGADGSYWNMEELSAIGMTALAMKDKFEAEPGSSQRKKDFDDALKLSQQYSLQFLTKYSHPGPENYYYEGPHHLCAWISYFMPFSRALLKAYPNSDPMFSLAADQPQMRFMRAQLMTVLPSSTVDKTEKIRWSIAPLDDSWITDTNLDPTVPFIETGAWAPADNARFIDAANRLKSGYPALNTGTGFGQEYFWSALVLGTPALEALSAPPVQDMPRFQATTDGVAVARTGSTEDDLTVVLKNTVTPMDKDVPSLNGHAHADNGSVCAFRNGETILEIPGYGEHGYANHDRRKLYCNWEHHNIPMIDNGSGYPADLKTEIGETGNFTVLTRPAGEARKTEAIEIDGQHGKAICLRTDLGDLERFVIVPNKDSILIVDRLKKAATVKLSWWGDGCVTDSTAKFEDADEQFLRPAKTKVKIESLLGGVPYKTDTVDSKEGFHGWNYQANNPLSGAQLTSSQPILYTATVVELGDGTAWDLTPSVKVDGQGAITSVGIKSKKSNAVLDEYVLPVNWTEPAAKSN